MHGAVTASVPNYKTTKSKFGNPVETQVPLFTGYVFVQCDLDKVSFKLLELPFCLGFLRFGTKYAVVSADEMARMRAMIASGRLITVLDEFIPGQLVRVKKGALSGQDFTLIKLKGEYQVVLSMPMLGRSCAVPMDRANVEAIQKSVA